MQRGMAGTRSNLRESEVGYPDTRDAGVPHAQMHSSQRHRSPRRVIGPRNDPSILTPGLNATPHFGASAHSCRAAQRSFMHALGLDADRLQLLYVRVDAERDTLQAMADYLQALDPRIVSLSGTEAQIPDAARSFRFYYRRFPLERRRYTIDQPASAFLLEESRQFAGTIDHEETQPVAFEKLRMLVGRG